jgi:F-type H+-transporting ATPase subunit a
MVMFNSSLNFAAEEGVPLAAEPILNIGGFGFTNAMLYGLIIAAIVLTLFSFAAHRTTVKPDNKLTFAIEMLVGAIIKLGEDNFGSRKKALKHLPLLLTLFTFILFSNLSGLIPGVGSINITHDGEVSPLLRPFTTDLNATLGMAILTIGTVQFWALRELGLRRHLKHYFAVVEPWWNPMNGFIGLIEVMGEFIRIITLSMRLFGVIYAGEVLLHVIADLSGSFGPIATFPVYLMEIFFSGIQAYLFMMLTMVYMANATHSDDDHEHDEGIVPEPVKVTG